MVDVQQSAAGARFRLAVMHAQKDLGISIPEEALKAYLRVKEEVDLDRTPAGTKLRHDVKARIEEFANWQVATDSRTLAGSDGQRGTTPDPPIIEIGR